jgi:peptide/nickel transport system ATP-binding protein
MSDASNARRDGAPGGGPPVMGARSLSKHFPVHHGRWASAGRASVHAVDDVSLDLFAGMVTAIVGESGSGKSTVARLLARLYPPTSGSIELQGRPVNVRRRATRAYARQVQMILQDPFSSLNPVHTVEYHLERPLRIHGHARTSKEARTQVRALLEEVKLTPADRVAASFPHELSGGQRQRVAIARALAPRPAVMLADEPVSMLDVSIRLGILNLLAELATEKDLAVLYITHDIASARYFAATTLVMYAGQLMEGGPSEAVTQHPAHPYARLLIDAAPDPGRAPSDARATGHDRGEPPSLIEPPSGCRFHPRCPSAMDICVDQVPPTTTVGQGHWTRCWLHVPDPQPVELGRRAGNGPGHG